MSEDSKSFYFYFKENMESMGLPAPESLFGTVSIAAATITALAAPLKDYGPHATIGQLSKLVPLAAAASPVAAIIIDKATVLAGCIASFYVGACIGSLAIAEAKSGGTWVTRPIRAYITLQMDALRPYRSAARIISNTSISDIFDCAKKHGIPIPSWLQKTLIAYPELCNADMRGIDRIALRKAQWAKLAVA